MYQGLAFLAELGGGLTAAIASMILESSAIRLRKVLCFIVVRNKMRADKKLNSGVEFGSTRRSRASCPPPRWSHSSRAGSSKSIALATHLRDSVATPGRVSLASS